MPAEEAVEDSRHIERALIIAGGDMTTVPSPTSDAVVIAADSGYDHALRVGLDVDLLIGDLDSITDEGLDHARTAGVQIIEHPADKDHTDLELALDHAVASGASQISVHGGEAGSLGHLLGVALELTDRRWADVDVRWHSDGATACVARAHRTVALEPAVGSVVSLIPVGDVTGVQTSGLQWSLDGDDLLAGTSRGMRNRATHPSVEVSVTGGALLVIVEEPHV